jgi:hypothetical protein
MAVSTKLIFRLFVGFRHGNVSFVDAVVRVYYEMLFAIFFEEEGLLK